MPSMKRGSSVSLVTSPPTEFHLAVSCSALLTVAFSSFRVWGLSRAAIIRRRWSLLLLRLVIVGWAAFTVDSSSLARDWPSFMKLEVSLAVRSKLLAAVETLLSSFIWSVSTSILCISVVTLVRLGPWIPSIEEPLQMATVVLQALERGLAEPGGKGGPLLIRATSASPPSKEASPISALVGRARFRSAWLISSSATTASGVTVTRRTLPTKTPL